MRVVFIRTISIDGATCTCTVASNSGGKNFGSSRVSGLTSGSLYCGAPSVCLVIGLAMADPLASFLEAGELVWVVVETLFSILGVRMLLPVSSVLVPLIFALVP